MFLLSTAFALSIDLDGDGKAETISYDANSMKVHIGTHTIECDGDPCDLAAHDISSADKAKQVAVCEHGIRDQINCRMLSIQGGKLVEYTYPKAYRAESFKTSGNGLVLVEESYRHRLIDRIEKFRVEGLKLVEVKQPIYTASKPTVLHIDRTFPLLFAPNGKQVVANCRPDSDVKILGEHGTHEEWLLVRLSSGITGWVRRPSLEGASTAYMQIMGAG